MKKPKSIYNAIVKGELLCDCGEILAKENDGTYKCTNKVCRRYDQKLIAIIMPIAAMYLAKDFK